jgi:hypothetical protein
MKGQTIRHQSIGDYPTMPTKNMRERSRAACNFAYQEKNIVANLSSTGCDDFASTSFKNRKFQAASGSPARRALSENLNPPGTECSTAAPSVSSMTQPGVHLEPPSRSEFGAQHEPWHGPGLTAALRLRPCCSLLNLNLTGLALSASSRYPWAPFPRPSGPGPWWTMTVTGWLVGHTNTRNTRMYIQIQATHAQYKHMHAYTYIASTRNGIDISAVFNGSSNMLLTIWYMYLLRNAWANGLVGKLTFLPEGHAFYSCRLHSCKSDACCAKKRHFTFLYVSACICMYLHVYTFICMY